MSTARIEDKTEFINLNHPSVNRTIYSSEIIQDSTVTYHQKQMADF